MRMENWFALTPLGEALAGKYTTPYTQYFFFIIDAHCNATKDIPLFSSERYSNMQLAHH